jgi:hypothetical protein
MNFEHQGGLSHEAFLESEARQNDAVHKELVKRLEGQTRLYFEFANTEQRDTAMQIINKTRAEEREFNDIFLHFEGCVVDSERQDVGIEIRFSKHPKNIREKFELLLRDQGIVPREEYETLNGEIEPEETKINYTE